eukprot:4094698-Pyramimonas_sp.AAC.1
MMRRRRRRRMRRRRRRRRMRRRRRRRGDANAWSCMCHDGYCGYSISRCYRAVYGIGYMRA